MEVLAKVTACNRSQLELAVDRKAACQGCASAGVCGGSWQFSIDRSENASEEWLPGDQVAITPVNFWGLVALSYLLPFIIFLTLLIIGTRLGDDLLAYSLAILALVVYYLGLWACKKMLAKIVFYKIKKSPTR